MEGVGGPELMMILFVVLLLFGGQKLPEFARGLGKAMREFKKAAGNVEDEIKRAMDEPDERPAIKPAPALKPAEPTKPATPPEP
ncbi:MAG: twin-arginine translocase TatA/TatE family subunit [Opitutaceae bacterium]|nr:twin-arginine translocase TatA/TatE family subunit [Opitutaceae bacterium]